MSVPGTGRIFVGVTGRVSVGVTWRFSVGFIGRIDEYYREGWY